MKYILITALLISSLWSSEWKSNKNIGLEAFKNDNYVTAIHYLEKVSKDDGDYEDSIKEMISYSYSKLGYKEIHKHNLTNAIKYFKKAYQYGNEYACNNIGNMYIELKDSDNAMKWFKKGAYEHGESQADCQSQLAHLYIKDNVNLNSKIQSNVKEAVKYYRLSAANGNKLAKKNLGVVCKYNSWACK